MNGIPTFPFEPEHQHWVFFARESAPMKPVVWGRVKCRKADKWIMYDPSTGGTRIFDTNGFMKPIGTGIVLKLVWVGRPDDFVNMTNAARLDKVQALLEFALPAPTPLITQRIGRPAILPYEPIKGEFVFFVDTKEPQRARIFGVVKHRQGKRWTMDQVNGTHTYMFDQVTGLMKPWGTPYQLAWICSEKEMPVGTLYTEAFAIVNPLIQAEYERKLSVRIREVSIA